MVSSNEIKQHIVRYIFPVFSNKLTWFVAGTGATILLTPSPLIQLFYNLLVDTFNLNSGEHFTLAELQANPVDYWIGFSLIFLALSHNLVYRMVIYKTEKVANAEHEKQVEVDRLLYKELIAILPSGGLSVNLLAEHDFFNSYDGNSCNGLTEFAETWDNAEKQFLDVDLEEKRSELLNKVCLFWNKLTGTSYAMNNGFFSCIADPYRGMDDYPLRVREQITELNDLATECFDKHKDLIFTAKRTLKC